MNVQIQTTSECNGNCVFCPYPESWQKKNPGRMTWGLFQNIVGQLNGYELGQISIYLENEPLCDKGLATKIEYLYDNLVFMKLELSTNAAKYSRKVIEALLKGPHEVRVSFHAIDKESYEQNMGLNYDKALETVEKYRDSGVNLVIWGAGGARLPIATPTRAFSKQEFETFWKGYRTHYFTFHDRAGSIQRNSVNFGITRDIPRCSRPKSWLHILYDGSVTLCCMDYRKEALVGDLNTQSIAEILPLRKQTDICRRCMSPGG